MLYFILLCPSKILFKFKCYTSLHIEKIDHIDDILSVNRFTQQQKHNTPRSKHIRYSLRLSALHPKVHNNLRTLSSPAIAGIDHQSMTIDQNQNISNATHS
jgi:hypothetical protein